jgi:sorbitol-6-phosphate 2-dehydrogenase
MIPSRSGNIVHINSKSGKKGSYKNSAYASAKFAGIGFTQSLALEMAEYGIRVNAICPGNLLNSPLWTEGPNCLFKQYAANQGITEAQVRQKYLNQVPLGRSCEYEDIANAMVFLASNESSYMTGQAINVTGGQEMR